MEDLEHLYHNDDPVCPCRKIDAGLERKLEEVGVQKWGKTDEFEDLMLLLAEKYKREITEIGKGKKMKELDYDLQQKIKEIGCKLSLAEAFVQLNIQRRVVRSQEERFSPEVFRIILCQDTIFTADISEEGDPDKMPEYKVFEQKNEKNDIMYV